MGAENESDTENQGEQESILDEAARGGAGDESNDDGDNGDDEETSGSIDTDALVAQVTQQVTEALADRFDSVADRRVNALLKEIRKSAGSQEESKDEGEQPQSGGVDRSLLRNSKAAFREYLTDELTFVGAPERELAMSLGDQLMTQAILSGDDDDDVIGRQAARAVVDQVRRVRTFYEGQITAVLRKRGVLVETEKDQPANGGTGVGATSEFEKGAALAAARFGKKE